MAARTRIGFSPALAIGPKRGLVVCHFTTDNDGDVATITDGEVSEGAYSVTRTGAGTYAVKLQRQYSKVFWAQAHALGAGTDATHIRHESTANTGGKTVVVFKHYSGGAAADIAAATVHCLMIVKGR